VYKKAWELPRVLELFEKESGAHFDPRVVDALMSCLPDLLAVRDRYRDAVSDDFASEPRL